MYEHTAESEQNIIDYNVNIRTITFLIIVTVIMLTLVFFIRIYSSNKAKLISDMENEAELLERIISSNINYSKYFINIVSNKIQNDHNNLDHINQTIHDFFQFNDMNLLFGWRKYSWVDRNFNVLVTSLNGIEKKPKHLSFMEGLIDIQKPKPYWKDNIIFHFSKATDKGDSLKIINNIASKETGEYAGSVILSYDIHTLVNSLNARKHHTSTNFILLSKRLYFVAQSQKTIDNIIDDQNVFSHALQKGIEDFNPASDYSYLDMVHGINFYIKSIKDTPFVVVVNIDNKMIKQNIISSVTKEFLKVAMFALISLITVIAIYKRETILRARSETAKAIANNANQAKTNFLKFTAHEIRSPLGFILTGSEMMTKELFGKLSKSYMEYAEGIHKNAQLILNFITDILDENQIIEGKFKIQNSINDIVTIIQESVRINKARYNERNIKISVQCDKDLPSLICDKDRMLQVMSNLISNSIKYSNDDTVILVKAYMVQNKLQIQVIDQGCGMRDEDIKTSLSEYGTQENQTYHSAGSYGLGLPIVKMLLDAHDATLKIASNDQIGGTIVTITFPKSKLVFNKINRSNNVSQR